MSSKPVAPKGGTIDTNDLPKDEAAGAFHDLVTSTFTKHCVVIGENHHLKIPITA